MNDRPDVECQECFWQGYDIELVSATDDLSDTDFIFCPMCGSDDVIDIECDDHHCAVLGT